MTGRRAWTCRRPLAPERSRTDSPIGVEAARAASGTQVTGRRKFRDHAQPTQRALRRAALVALRRRSAPIGAVSGGRHSRASRLRRCHHHCSLRRSRSSRHRPAPFRGVERGWHRGRTAEGVVVVGERSDHAGGAGLHHGHFPQGAGWSEAPRVWLTRRSLRRHTESDPARLCGGGTATVPPALDDPGQLRRPLRPVAGGRTTPSATRIRRSFRGWRPAWWCKSGPRPGTWSCASRSCAPGIVTPPLSDTVRTTSTTQRGPGLPGRRGRRQGQRPVPTAGPARATIRRPPASTAGLRRNCSRP
jgi:hypothetical protein